MSRAPDPTARITLLRAAEAVFAESGLERAKVEDITKRAGLSKGAFYLHFESKEDAFREVAESFLARCGAIIADPAQQMATLSPAEIFEFWRHTDTEIFEFLWQNRSIVVMLESCSGPHHYLLETFRTGILNQCQSWIEVLKKRGLYRAAVDPSTSAIVVLGAYHEISMHIVRAAKKPPIAFWVAQIIETFARAFGTPEFVQAFVVDTKDQTDRRIAAAGE
jgi:AcrR family transcriptional regulator